MPKNTQDEKKPKRRTQVKDLPKQEKVLSEDEQKKVKGGSAALAPTPAMKKESSLSS
ncbi:MAG TPA: hypothetical protein VIP46_18205 [Pyrinomonadaceae bacterium]